MSYHTWQIISTVIRKTAYCICLEKLTEFGKNLTIFGKVVEIKERPNS